MLFTLAWASLAAVFSFSIAMVVWGRNGDGTLNFWGAWGFPKPREQSASRRSSCHPFGLCDHFGYLSFSRWSARSSSSQKDKWESL